MNLLPHILLLTVLLGTSKAQNHEKQLLDQLFASYNPVLRPRVNYSDTVAVTLAGNLIRLVQVNEKEDSIKTQWWLVMTWKDDNLVWNPTEFGHIQKLNVPSSKIWRPDLFLYNSAEEKLDVMSSEVHVLVSYDGMVTYVPPITVKSGCSLHSSFFPFEPQTCTLKLGSWTYSSDKVDLQMKDCSLRRCPINLENYVGNPDWTLTDASATRNEKQYECCPEKYVDISYRIDFKRRPTFYVLTLIVPCILLSILALVTFVVPPDSGAKIYLGIGVFVGDLIMLALCVKSGPVVSTIYNVPILVVYLVFLLIQCGLCLVCSAIVVNIHHCISRVPSIIKTVVNVHVARILLVNACSSGDKEFNASDAEEKQRWHVTAKVVNRLFFIGVLTFTVIGTTVIFLAW